MADYPMGQVVLNLVGHDIGGHTFMVNVEEPIPDYLALQNRQDVRMPWLRARCTCGWKAKKSERTSLEENAHWRWITHARVFEEASGG